MKSVIRSIDLTPFNQIMSISLSKNSKMAAEVKFLWCLVTVIVHNDLAYDWR